MKKKCAVFTISKNEYYFLPKWLKHYKKYFDDEDIYILDHESDDDSTDNLNVNVIKIVNDIAFDHQWLTTTVENYQRELLEKYECVLFADSDELIYTYPRALNETIDLFLKSNETIQTCLGYEVIQNLELESPLKETDLIFENRDYWFRYPLYDKPLLSKIPLNWEWGFHHTLDHRRSNTFNLILCHLHRCDFELMFKRHKDRLDKWNIKDDGESGFQHRIPDREGILGYFNTIPSNKELINKEHKKIFYDI